MNYQKDGGNGVMDVFFVLIAALVSRACTYLKTDTIGHVKYVNYGTSITPE